MIDDRPLVEVRNVWKSYGTTEVLRGVDLNVSEGQVVCLIGPSGAGKSTLLRCVNHLERVDHGIIVVDGELIGYRWREGELVEMKDREICRQRANIGMVFQQFNLFQHMTVLENLTVGPRKLKGKTRDEAAQRAQELLNDVGLSEKADSYPAELSGGQAQRVGIARALAMEPRLMLFDEPTSALDPELVGDVLDIMTLLVENGMTMLVVTHEMGFARDAADVVAFMADGEILESGPPGEVLIDPKVERTQQFLARV